MRLHRFAPAFDISVYRGELAADSHCRRADGVGARPAHRLFFCANAEPCIRRTRHGLPPTQVRKKSAITCVPQDIMVYEGGMHVKRLMIFTTFIVASLGLLASISGAAAAGTPVKASIVYNSTIANGRARTCPASEPRRMPSRARKPDHSRRHAARNLTSVTVTMSSWACVTGSWNGATAARRRRDVRTPITLNIYGVAIRSTDRNRDADVQHSLQAVHKLEVHRR